MKIDPKYDAINTVHRTLPQNDDPANNIVSCGFLPWHRPSNVRKNICFSHYGGLYVLRGKGKYIDMHNAMIIMNSNYGFSDENSFSSNIKRDKQEKMCAKSKLLIRFRKEFLSRKIAKIQGAQITEAALRNISERTTGESLAIMQNIFELALTHCRQQIAAKHRRRTAAARAA